MASNNSGNCYKYRYLSEPDDALKCLICLEVAEEPWQHVDCGRLFCRECLDKHGRRKPCPNCRTKCSEYFPDNRGKREIRSLQVKCHNVERTCPWEGTVGTVEEHVATCQFTLLPCPNQCKDHSNKTNHIMRKDLEHHLKEDCSNREYKCEYCGEEGTYATITQVHDEVCPNKIVSCTNSGCSWFMSRCRISQHVESDCNYTVIACKYKSIGCETELKRKDMPAHELDDKLHLHMAINTITMMKEESETTILKTGEPMTLKFSGYQERKENEKQFTSSCFYISPGYRMAITVDANGSLHGENTHISIYAPIIQGKYDSELPWPLVGSLTFTLLNQLEDRNHHSETLCLTTELSATPGDSWGIPDFILHSELDYDPIKNTQYLRDDTLYFRVSVEVANHKPWLECRATT